MKSELYHFLYSFSPHTLTFELHYSTTLSWSGKAYRLTKITAYRHLLSTGPVPLPPFLSPSLHTHTSSPAIPLGTMPTTSDLLRGLGITPQHVPYPHRVLTTLHGLKLHEMRQSSLEQESNQRPPDL